MLAPEEQARAGIYGLLAALFRAPPDPALLDALAGADEVYADDDVVTAPWVELAYAAARTDCESVRGEFKKAFRSRTKAREAARRLAAVCEVQRGLITSEETSLAEQRRYFSAHVVPAAKALAKSYPPFYQRVARFAAAFFRVETTAFELFPSDLTEQTWH